ncbi:KXD1 [[Candida] subhashii]|uniref:KXD1 n=1 Tax=[Candida] subhashii TaxID=561895 RepID=A0A8J5QJE5_9ASCO|nr:KXD1 [[Candida] subhashii]KAG7663223.1 KXD1 [[Candida] subhashii]
MHPQEANSNAVLSEHDYVSSIDSSLVPEEGTSNPVNGPVAPEAFLDNNELNQSSGTDDDDDYIISDDEEISLMLTRSQDLPNPHLPFSGSLVDHANYFSNTLSRALDSVEMDKSLVLEAQISGNLNNENQRILEKKKVLIEKLKGLQQMCLENFGNQTATGESKLSKIEQMKHDILNIENRIEILKNGKNASFKIPLFKKTSTSKSIGVVSKYPIEYNQAKDKVLERQIDDQ